MKTLPQLRSEVQRRLSDLGQQVWTADEVDLHLQNAYGELATRFGVFFDWTYLESRPAGFTVTQRWEEAWIDGVRFTFTYGTANYTLLDEVTALGSERQRVGPANHTCPFELADGFLDAVGASPAIPATGELPRTLTRLDRVTWDTRTIDALEARRLSRLDSRYEITTGEVYGFIWQKDGIRTLRKVRVPAARADLPSVTGRWGVLRDPTDLASTEPLTGTTTLTRQFVYTALWEVAHLQQSDIRMANYTYADEATALTPSSRIGPAWYTADFEGDWLTDLGRPDTTPRVMGWGVPRRIKGHHPLGPEGFGVPRRPFLEGKNLRVEHFRQGRDLGGPAACELPDRYAMYLRDYAQAQCLQRPGPGQDVALAKHFQDRWQRGLARIARRLDLVDAERVVVFGGDARPLVTRPPRPKRPWAYGEVVR